MSDTEPSQTAAGTAGLTDEERYKAFSSYADTSRKWVAVMDTKAAFAAALNLGLLTFLWTGAKLSDCEGCVRWLAALATVLSLSSIGSVIFAAMPRESLTQIFGGKMVWRSHYQPISYYGYIASKYGKNDFASLKGHSMKMTMSDLATEALEQHFVISHSVAKKSAFVKLAGVCLLAALAVTGIALVIRICL